MRKEKDFLGEIEIPKEALYGIHSCRAAANFPDQTAFHVEWYKAMGIVKLACYNTYRQFKKAVLERYTEDVAPINFFSNEIIFALEKSATEVSLGEHYKSFIVPAIQGGAGTSINMNINEIVTNRALQILEKNSGDYLFIDPIEHANIYQSTNDVVPTALRVAVMELLQTLEESINKLRFTIEKLEKENRDIMRVAFTQMQQAVPSSYGHLFSTYNDALSRDWWRVSKCFERIKVVNLGGSAIGTGITVPRYFIMEAVAILQKLTKMPVTRGENLSDATNNLDSFVEIHAILKAHAVNLEKIVSDVRLLASDIVAQKEVKIPKKQVGSSIMPGKINPVIPEFVISAAHKIYSNDQLITSLSAQGCLDLNAYIPTIGHALLETIKLLIASNNTLRDNLFNELEIDGNSANSKLMKSPAITTALVPYIGYNKAAILSKTMQENSIDVIEANRIEKLINEDKLLRIIEPRNLLKIGFSITDLQE